MCTIGARGGSGLCPWILHVDIDTNHPPKLHIKNTVKKRSGSTKICAMPQHDHMQSLHAVPCLQHLSQAASQLEVLLQQAEQAR